MSKIATYRTQSAANEECKIDMLVDVMFVLIKLSYVVSRSWPGPGVWIEVLI